MRYASTPFRSIYGAGTFHCFSFGKHEEDKILVIEAKDVRMSKLIRVQSACYTAEIFRSTDCDCHEQLDASLELIFKKGGLVVYMLCDGRGAGLLPKVRALRMWEESKIDTHDAYAKMKIKSDPRSYKRLKKVLAHFKLTEVKLLTNNPRKIKGLENLGIKVKRVSLEVSCHEDARPYLMTKKTKMGHLLKLK